MFSKQEGEIEDILSYFWRNVFIGDASRYPILKNGSSDSGHIIGKALIFFYENFNIFWDGKKFHKKNWGDMRHLSICS